MPCWLRLSPSFKIFPAKIRTNWSCLALNRLEISSLNCKIENMHIQIQMQIETDTKTLGLFPRKQKYFFPFFSFNQLKWYTGVEILSSCFLSLFSKFQHYIYIISVLISRFFFSYSCHLCYLKLVPVSTCVVSFFAGPKLWAWWNCYLVMVWLCPITLIFLRATQHWHTK